MHSEEYNDLIRSLPGSSVVKSKELIGTADFCGCDGVISS